MRMSYSSIIRESEDFGAALTDAEGRQLCECKMSTPLQSGPIPGYVRGIRRRLAARGDVFRPGDVIMHNDPYGGASHGPDVAFCVPVFDDDELLGFSVTTAHHLDIGAHTPGSCGIVDAVVVYLFILLGHQEDSAPIPEADNRNQTANYLTVSATKEDFEGIANTYIRKAINKEPLPVTMKVEDDIMLLSELTVFSYTLPVIMHFDPIVREDGNLILKQSSSGNWAIKYPAFNCFENIEGFCETSPLDDCSSKRRGIVYRSFEQFPFRVIYK